MNKNISYKAVSIVFSVLVICFLMVFYSLAWTDAPGVPPVCPSDHPGCDAPLNTGAVEQIKSGPLRIGGVFRTDSATYLATGGGNVGIGTTSPGAKLYIFGDFGVVSSPYPYKYTRGSYVSGHQTPRCSCDTSASSVNCPSTYFLTATDEGAVCYDQYTTGWRGSTQRSYPFTRSANDDYSLYVNKTSGNVGIGTASPSQALDVQGNIVASGSVCANGGSNCIGDGTSGDGTSFTLALTDCQWSERRYYQADQDKDCQDYFGRGYVVVNYDCIKDNDYCRYNRIKCCKLNLVPKSKANITFLRDDFQECSNFLDRDRELEIELAITNPYDSNNPLADATVRWELGSASYSGRDAIDRCRRVFSGVTDASGEVVLKSGCCVRSSYFGSECELSYSISSVTDSNGVDLPLEGDTSGTIYCP